MSKKVFNIISGAKSGALNIALEIGHFLKLQGYQINTILRKYNKTDLQDVIVIEDKFTFDYINKLSRLIKSDKPDIILVHGYSTHIWTKIAVAYAKVPVKVIHVEHNAERYTPLRRYLVKKLDKYTDKYICVSKGVANHLLKQGVDKNKVVVVYNGINIEKFNIPKESHDIYTVGMTARFSKQKDQMTLIKAVERIIKEYKQEIRLILLGDGKTKAECQSYVEKNGLKDNVIFKTGRFIDIIPFLDLFVLATHYEGFGLVVVEAMAGKIPVIASNVVGVNEIINDGKNGFLVEENNYKVLAEKIIYCLENQYSKFMQDIINNAEKLVEQKFSIDNMCKLYKYYIKEIYK